MPVIFRAFFVTKMDYKKYYKDITGEKIPNGFDIHHLNLDHNENRFGNLVAIPKDLHQKYHNCLPMIEKAFQRGLIVYPANDINISGALVFDTLQEWLNLSREINKYIRLRDCFISANNVYNFEYWLNINDVKELYYEVYNNN